MKCKGILNEEPSLLAWFFAFSAASPSSPVQKQQKEELVENEPTKYCGHKDMQRGTLYSLLRKTNSLEPALDTTWWSGTDYVILDKACHTIEPSTYL